MTYNLTPFIFSYDPSRSRTRVTIDWGDRKLAYVLDRTRYIDAPEVKDADVPSDYDDALDWLHRDGTSELYDTFFEFRDRVGPPA